MNAEEIRSVAGEIDRIRKRLDDGNTLRADSRHKYEELKALLSYLEEHADTSEWEPLPLTECVCGGAYGYYQPVWPKGHRMSGERWACLCLPEVKRREKAERMKRYIPTANIPERFRDASLLNMDTTHPETKTMVEKALTYLAEKLTNYTDIPEALQPYFPHHWDEETDEEINPVPWLPEMLALFGMYGTGKTRIAVALIKGFVREGVEARYAYVPDLLDDLRAAYRVKDDEEGGYYELLGKLKNVEVLALDDVGSEKATEWADEQIDKIVDYRYRNSKLTIITANVEITQLPGRTADRLRDQDACLCLTTSAPSYRPKKRKE